MNALSASQISALDRYLHGEVPLGDVMLLLHPLVSFDSYPAMRSLTVDPAVKPVIHVEPSDLVPKIEAYLAGQCSPQELSDWAALVLLCDAYDLPNDEVPETAEAAEIVRDVLWCLCALPVADNVDPQSAHFQLDRLKEVGNAPAV